MMNILWKTIFGTALCLLTVCGARAGALFSLPPTGCQQAKDCSDDEFCAGMGTAAAKCRPVQCGDGKEAKNHVCKCIQGVLLPSGECLKQQCSSDSDCTEMEVCVNPGIASTCAILDCSADEKAENHTCVKKACAEIDDRYKTDCAETEEKISVGKSGSDGVCFLCGSKRSCAVADDCPLDEECVDGKCSPLNCFSCQKADNHECLPMKDCCVTDDECAFYEKCVKNVCVQKTCAEINPDYRRICNEREKLIETDQTGSDGKCYTCTPKTCAEMNPQYKTACKDKETPLPQALAADGMCYICRLPLCFQLVPEFRECVETEIKLSTDIYGFEGECYKCVEKGKK